MYLSLTAFHCHIFTHKFPRSTLFKLSIPFLCTTPSFVFSHHVTPLTMLSPLTSTQCLQHSPWADSGVQDIMTQFAYEHVNNSLFTQLYQNRNNQLNAHFQRPVPSEPTCMKFSQWCCPIFNSCNICVKKQFSSFRFLTYSIQSSTYSTHTSLSNKIPWSSSALQHTMYTAHGMELKAMPQTPNISP
jgi:hypothetical protein